MGLFTADVCRNNYPKLEFPVLKFPFHRKMATQAAVEGEFPPGTRVVDADGFKATVVYVGPVATAKNADDVWLGNAAACLVGRNAQKQHGRLWD